MIPATPAEPLSAAYDPALSAAMFLHGFAGARVDACGVVLSLSSALAKWIGAPGGDAFQSPYLAGLEEEFERLRRGEAKRLFLPNLALGEGARINVSIVWLEQEAFYDIHSRLLGESDEMAAALARERRARRLAQEQAGNAKAKAEIQARIALLVRERLRIAHDLHDTIVHALVAVVAQLGLVKKLFARAPDRTGEEIERAYEAAREGLARAREALGQVRFERAGVDGLGAALERAALRFEQRAGIAVTCEIAEACREIGGEQAEILYRIVEEGLRNIASHAQARHVTLTAEADARELRIELSDDGVGFDDGLDYPGHYGLIGMREQARMIGARLSIAARPGKGARVSLEISFQSLRAEPAAVWA